MTLTVFFHTFHAPTPYISGQEPISYECDGKEGVIFFNGYYYVENHAPPYPEDELVERWERPRRYDTWLPKEALLFVKEEEGGKVIQDHLYRVEIYKKELYESTDSIGTDIDAGGEMIDICLFPTNKQRIYFRVLEEVVVQAAAAAAAASTPRYLSGHPFLFGGSSIFNPDANDVKHGSKKI
jgi:hypothetical protein